MKNITTKKKKSNKDVSINVIRHSDNKGGHHHIVLGEIDNRYISVGFTTKKKKGKNSTNYPLKKDPLGGNKTSYMRRQGTVDPKGVYSDKRKGVMAQEDFERACSYGKKAKEKYLLKNKKR